MVRTYYIPNRGDIAWVDLDPVRGHEQGGRRPVFVVSSKYYNEKSGLMLVCPITSQIKGYPFEVVFISKQIKGAILTDQVRSIDWDNRDTDFAGKIDDPVVETVQGKLKRLIDGL